MVQLKQVENKTSHSGIRQIKTLRKLVKTKIANYMIFIQKQEPALHCCYMYVDHSAEAALWSTNLQILASFQRRKLIDLHSNVT